MSDLTLLTVKREDLVKMAKDRKLLNVFAVKSGISGAAGKETSALIEEILQEQKNQFDNGGKDAVTEAIQTTFKENNINVDPPTPTAVVVAPTDEETRKLLEDLHMMVTQIKEMLSEGIQVVEIKEEVEEKSTLNKEGDKDEVKLEAEETIPLSKILRGDIKFITALAEQVGALSKIDALGGNINAQRQELITHLRQNNYNLE
jgi:hypothetical protein